MTNGPYKLADSDSSGGRIHSETVRHSSLYNEDLAPIPTSRRTWGTYNYAALWIAMSVNIPTYLLASGMIAGGMDWKQAIFTVFLGNVLVLVPMLLNAHAGAKYGIPFPVFARASFGVRHKWSNGRTITYMTIFTDGARFWRWPTTCPARPGWRARSRSRCATC